MAANLNIYSILGLGQAGIFLVLIIIFAIRPLNVWLSTRKSPLALRDKFYLSWIAPRGIVAASLASLFTLELQQINYPQAQMLEAMVYAVIGVTVTLQGLSSGVVAHLLKVVDKTRNGILIVGAHPMAQALAKWLKEKKIDTILVDTNIYNVTQAQNQGLDAYNGSILDHEFLSHIHLHRMGWMLAMTTNHFINAKSCEIGRTLFGAEHCVRVAHPQYMESVMSNFTDKLYLGNLPPIEFILDAFQQKKYTLKLIDLKTHPLPKQTTIGESLDIWPLLIDFGDKIEPITSIKDLKGSEKILVLQKKETKGAGDGSAFHQ